MKKLRLKKKYKIFLIYLGIFFIGSVILYLFIPRNDVEFRNDVEEISLKAGEVKRKQDLKVKEIIKSFIQLRIQLLLISMRMVMY